MKKLAVAFILSIALTGNAQDLKNWQVGININPFIFSRIHLNGYPKKDTQNFPNGFGYGFTIEKNWNEHWGIKTGFESCKQNQKYKFYYQPGIVYPSYINSGFSYYKIPLTIVYSYPLNDKIFLTFNQGFQYSKLNRYNITEKWNGGLAVMRENGGDLKKDLLGLVGSIGIKSFLYKNFSYSMNLRYEYDLTRADINPITSLEPDNWGDLTNTRNFRIGLELGVQYHFSLEGCDFCKNQLH